MNSIGKKFKGDQASILRSKKIPKLYVIVFGFLLLTLTFLIYKYISFRSSYNSGLKEYEMITSNNELLIKETKILADDLKSLKQRIVKNEAILDDTVKNVDKLKEEKTLLLQSIDSCQKEINEFSKEGISEGIKFFKEEYINQQRELNQIQNEIYKKATIAHSNILVNIKEKQLIEDWLGKKIGAPCYLSDIDGFSTNLFFKRCEKYGPTVTLYQSSSERFGGYTSTSWEMAKEPIYKSDQDAFIFSINKMKKYLPKTTEKIILNSEDYFPSFGPKDILISQSSSSSNFPDTFGDLNEDKNSQFFIKNDTFDIVRIEVYLLK